MATGTGEVDFGAFPGTDSATLVVTGQTAIAADSGVEAWVLPLAATVDHSADEQMLEEVKFLARDIVAGIGFTIYGLMTGEVKVHGKFMVGWAWV